MEIDNIRREMGLNLVEQFGSEYIATQIAADNFCILWEIIFENAK